MSDFLFWYICGCGSGFTVAAIIGAWAERRHKPPKRLTQTDLYRIRRRYIQ